MNPQGQPYNTLEELTNGGRCICHIIERRTGRQKHQQIVRSLNSTLNKRPKEKILCNNPQNSSKQFCIHNLWLHGLNQWSPTFLAPRTGSMKDSFSTGGGGGGGGFRVIQAHYTYCVLYFHYDYISSTSDCQAFVWSWRLRALGLNPLLFTKLLLILIGDLVLSDPPFQGLQRRS